MSGMDELKNMLLTFRVSELQMLLGYAGQNKTGRKTELQARAVDLLKNKNVPHSTQIHGKIRELYKSIQCSIQGCYSNWNMGAPGVQTFPLPRTEIVRKAWLRYIPRELHDLNPLVCIRHFSPVSFTTTAKPTPTPGGGTTVTTRVKLSSNAVPTIFPQIEELRTAYSRSSRHDKAYNWQGGSVFTQGTAAVPSSVAPIHPGTELPPNQSGIGGAPPMSSAQIPGAFLPIPDRIRGRNPSFINMYSGYPTKLMPMNNPPAPTPPTVPMYPEVRFKRLPFYDFLGDLLKPSTLSINSAGRDPTAQYVFFLTPKQATEVAFNRDVGLGRPNEYSVQVQMRFCALDTACDQDDQFPPGLTVKINGKLAPLPPQNNQPNKPTEVKKPSKPLNISPMVKLCPTVSNNVAITWNPDYQRGYVVTINLVRKLSSTELLDRLKQKGARHPDYTTGLIKDKLNDSDNDIATTSLRVSLICPLGKMRMHTAARASTCIHLQCFDGLVYISMNEKRPTWTCPVCNKPAIYDNLVIDGYFQNVLESPLLGESNEIELHKDGSWTPHDESQEHASHSSHKGSSSSHIADTTKDDQIEEIKDDDDEETGGVSGQNGVSSKPVVEKTEPVVAKEVEMVDLTETDDEDATPAPVKEVQPAPASIIPSYSDSTSSLSTATRSPPSIINLDSPSPSPPNTYLHTNNLPPTSVPSSNYMCHLRLPPDSRYHPY